MAEIAWRELQALLDAEVQRLPARYREPLILCYLEGKTHEEVARQLGCPVGTVHSWLVRGRELLRERLRRKGLTLAATAFAAALAVHTASAIPPALVERTVHAAACFMAGEAALSAVSQTAVLLARASVRSLVPLRLSVAMAGVLVFGLAAVGAVLWGHPFRLAPPTEVAGAAPPSASAQPQKEPPVPTDRYGDPLPDGVIARLGPTRGRLTSRDGTVAATPDGKDILTGSQSGHVLVWSSETGKVVRRMAGHRGTVAAGRANACLGWAGQDHTPVGLARGQGAGHARGARTVGRRPGL